MAFRVVWVCRVLVATMAALAIVTMVPGGVFARDTFDATGTVISKNEEKDTIVLITDSLGTKNQPITIDMSDMTGAFEAIRVGQSVSMQIAARESNSYLAYSILAEDSYVKGDDLGTQEKYETASSSIKAHVGNVPEDDEALSQQHRQNDLKRNEDDDHDNNPND